MNMLKLMVGAGIVLLSTQAMAMDLVRDGRSDYVVVLGSNASPSEHRAAAEFKRFIQEISGASLPYVEDSSNVPEKAIVIGDCKALRAVVPNIDLSNLGDEGYAIRTVGTRLLIAGGKLRGTMYGVYAFLEEQLGCRWYSSAVSYIPKNKNISLKELDITDKPAFEYRDVFYFDAFDKDWAARNRTNGATARLDTETGGRVEYYPFVHSFSSLVPQDKYWDSHPEYYSMVDGKRVKDSTQLCLTNLDVLKIATQTVLQWMREHPEAKIYSVSQNDCYNNCQCPKCKAVYEEEGSPSGLMLRFVNAIAEETAKVYPDKLIDTLAYQWTENPPKITKPRSNVRVRLCPIFCCEAHPYETCDRKENVAFMDSLTKWSKLTDNLYIWHYNTSFSNYLNPFPQFLQLADTTKLYKRSGVKGVFWEGSYQSLGGATAELSAYLLAKLSWNPDQDYLAIMKDFVNGYYGKAAPYIWDYLMLLQKKVVDDNIHVCIWAGPTDAYLTPEIVAKSHELFDKAEAVAESDAVRDRVKFARMSIRYVELMQPVITNTVGDKKAELEKQFEEFASDCRCMDITQINEGEGLDASVDRIKKAIADAK